MQEASANMPHWRSKPIGAGSLGSQADSDAAPWTLLFGVLLAILLVARILALHVNGTDLFFDEAQYWSWSREPDFGYYSKPPLVAWVIRAATEVCGNGEACVRLPSPIIHSATAIALFLLGSRLYDARVGALSGLAFATLPGVSLSAGIISTDVPLLFAWGLALFALASLFDTRSWWPALLLGLALGIGLNAKYAMAWFLVCLTIYLTVTPARRGVLGDPRLYAAFLIGLALIAPNLRWNFANGFATFAHTADNAKWDGVPVNPVKALEFFGAQFGVFGPILFAALVIIAWNVWKRGAAAPDRLLLAFSVPIVLVITGQAFLSRAHANWAATAYVAATVLVMATLVRNLDWRWLRASFALHVLVAVIIPLGAALAGRVVLPAVPDPFARTMGWSELAAATRVEIEKARARGQPFGAVLTDQRAVTAELLYYLRDEPTPVLAWREGGRSRDHFELVRPFTAGAREPLLLVSLNDASHIGRTFASVTDLGTHDVPTGARGHRRVAFHVLAGYRGQ